MIPLFNFEGLQPAIIIIILRGAISLLLHLFLGQSLSSDKKGIMLLVPSRESVLLQTNSEEEVNDDNNSAAVPLCELIINSYSF